MPETEPAISLHTSLWLRIPWQFWKFHWTFSYKWREGQKRCLGNWPANILLWAMGAANLNTNWQSFTLLSQGRDINHIPFCLAFSALLSEAFGFCSAHIAFSHNVHSLTHQNKKCFFFFHSVCEVWGESQGMPGKFLLNPCAHLCSESSSCRASEAHAFWAQL